MIEKWRWVCGEDPGSVVISLWMFSAQGCDAWREGKESFRKATLLFLHCSNSSCSISKLQWGGIAETQRLKIDFCTHWGIQRNFLNTVNVIQNHINCFLMWKWFSCYCFAQGLKLVLAWIALGHAERRYFPGLSISSRAINAFPWSLTCNVSQLSNKMLS